MEQKHTPGPWKQNGVSVPGRHQIDDARNKPICTTDARYDLRTGYQQADANAKLIAAAPDLLNRVMSMAALLERLAADAGLTTDTALDAVLAEATAARAAISKATS